MKDRKGYTRTTLPKKELTFLIVDIFLPLITVTSVYCLLFFLWMNYTTIS